MALYKPLKPTLLLLASGFGSIDGLGREVGSMVLYVCLRLELYLEFEASRFTAAIF